MRFTPHRFAYVCAGTLSLATLGAMALAMSDHAERAETAAHPERRDDPWRPMPGPVRKSTPAAQAGTDATPTFVQVNLDENGMNILGDAANEPSIAVDPTAPNRMAIGWRQFDTIQSNFRQAGYAWTVDGGRTWTNEEPIEAGLFRSDPVLDAGADGTFFYLSLRVTDQNEFLNDMFISDDGGKTWPEKHFAFGGDKAWFTIDDTNGVGAGNMYQAWNVAGNEFFPAQFNRSVDGGVTWEQPVEYTPNAPNPARPAFGILDVGPDGAVYVTGAVNAFLGDVFWVVKSSNAQFADQTPIFELATEVDPGGEFVFGAAPNPGGLASQMYVQVDHSGGPTHGNVYVLTSVDPDGSPDPMDVHLIRSTDGGKTWSEPIRVNDDPPAPNAWQWFATMSIAPNGRLDVVYNSTHNSMEVDVSQTFYTFSTDAGLSWSTPESLTTPWNSHVGWPNQDKIGDYYDMVSDNVGVDLALSTTLNDEQDVYYMRIGDYDCNRNDIGDEQDIMDGTSADCNENNIPDECEIAAGAVDDANGNGVPDVCELPGDLDNDNDIDVDDLLLLLDAWGPCDDPCPPNCLGDIDSDCTVGVSDLLTLLTNWTA